ncbi:MAG: ATP-binding cassette domain-containing protein [Gemmatimonadaceae bacterium]
MPDAITTEALRKVYPAPSGRRRPAAGGPGGPGGIAPAVSSTRTSAAGIIALDGLDLSVRRGELFGLLGPNGAGKTTTIGILTTRVSATSGRALVAGHDVATAAVRVRQHIGVVPQRPNPDRSLTTVENLVFHAAYFGFPFDRANRSALELLERLGISDKADAKVESLSGGQQQRLMIARALIHEPEVIFLDEPTVGLDPKARLDLWGILREMHAQGRTIVMTTHYMEEADQLCERVAIVDRGTLLACDTPERLKASAPGGTLIEVTLDGPAERVVAGVKALPHVSRAEAHGDVLHAYSDRSGEGIPAIIAVAQGASRGVTNIHLTSPSLESLFISMTGRKLD